MGEEIDGNTILARALKDQVSSTNYSDFEIRKKCIQLFSNWASNKVQSVQS